MLADIFLGRRGGTPSRNYAPAIKHVVGVDRAAVALDHTRRHWSVTVEGHLEVAATVEVATEETVACGIPDLDHPGQEVATSVLRVDAPPLRWERSERCGFATDFDCRAGA